jgi:hypothetical protein
VTVPGNVDAIHSIILHNRGITANMIAETLGISERKRMIYYSLDFTRGRFQTNEFLMISMVIRIVIECLFNKIFWMDLKGLLSRLLPSHTFSTIYINNEDLEEYPTNLDTLYPHSHGMSR